MDAPSRLVRIIEDSIRSAYQQHALESAVEHEEQLERAMQQSVGSTQTQLLTYANDISVAEASLG